MTKAKRKGTPVHIAQRTILAIETDKHGNHVMGLANPATLFERTRKVRVPGSTKMREERYFEPIHLNALQRELWKYRTADIAGVRRLAGADPIIVIDLGDQLGGARRPKEWVSTRLADQLAIGYYNWDPWFRGEKVPDAVRMATGTASHDLGEGSGAQIMAKYLRDKYQADAFAAYHHELKIAGLRFDIAHHGPGPGIRDWLKGNVLQLYVQSQMTEILNHEDIPPDVVLRGHYHTHIRRIICLDRNGDEYTTHARICPSYCFIDDYATQAAQSPTYVTIGMLAVEIIPGPPGHKPHFEFHRFMRTIDFRTVEEM
jgi:hypothetical protein